MISFDNIDMMARGGSLALLALWSWLLVRDHRSALAARMALLMNLAIACHIIASIPSIPDSRGQQNLIGLAVELGASAVPGFFWLFARTWFNDEVRIGWRSWALVALPPLAVVVLIAQYTAKGPAFATAAFIMRVLMFGFALAGLWAAWRGRDGDLVEARRQLRTKMIWAVGLFVILTNAIEILVFNDVLPDEFISVIEFGILILTGALCATMYGSRQGDLFAPQRILSAPNLSADDPFFAQRLGQHMDHERAWRDERLTIAGLAAQLGEQEYRLRRLINGQLGHRNFAAFLNGYRLAEVKAALADETQRAVPILTIALDAGFGSLGPFNRAFREAEGMTPRAYRLGQKLGDSEID